MRTIPDIAGLRFGAVRWLNHAGHAARIAALATLAALATACSSSTEPDRVRVLGTIAGYDPGDPKIALQESEGTVTIRVTTYGPDCYTTGETEVEQAGLEATLTPYDYAPPPDAACAPGVHTMEHDATLRFDESGTARIFVRGLSIAVDPAGDTITVERIVVIPHGRN